MLFRSCKIPHLPQNHASSLQKYPIIPKITHLLLENPPSGPSQDPPQHCPKTLLTTPGPQNPPQNPSTTPPTTLPPPQPPHRVQREDWIRAKYVEKKFVTRLPGAWPKKPRPPRHVSRGSPAPRGSQATGIGRKGWRGGASEGRWAGRVGGGCGIQMRGRGYGWRVHAEWAWTIGSGRGLSVADVAYSHSGRGQALHASSMQSGRGLGLWAWPDSTVGVAKFCIGAYAKWA